VDSTQSYEHEFGIQQISPPFKFVSEIEILELPFK